MVIGYVQVNMRYAIYILQLNSTCMHKVHSTSGQSKFYIEAILKSAWTCDHCVLHILIFISFPRSFALLKDLNLALALLGLLGGLVCIELAQLTFSHHVYSTLVHFKSM